MRLHTQILAINLLMVFTLVNLHSQPHPSWWTDADTRIIDPAGPPATTDDNYSPANLGQLKHVALQAKEHLDANLPNGSGGAGATINNLISQFEPRAGQNYTPAQIAAFRDVNYAPINLGQLKAVAKPFYDRLQLFQYDTRANLITRGFPSTWTHIYPWNPATPIADNYAPANIGQLKITFAFDLRELNGSNLLPLWWMKHYFYGEIGIDPNADSDFDGASNLLEFQMGTRPNESDTDGDGSNDGDEIRNSTNPNSSASYSAVWRGVYSSIQYDFDDYPPESGGRRGYLTISASWDASLNSTTSISSEIAWPALGGRLGNDAPLPSTMPIQTGGLAAAYGYAELHPDPPCYHATLQHQRFWIESRPAPVVEVVRTVLLLTERTIDGQSSPPNLQILSMRIPAGSTVSQAVSLQPTFYSNPTGNTYHYETVFMTLLPFELKDIKKVADQNDDVVIDAIPPKESGESENAYIQRSLTNKQIAYIEPHGAVNDTDPEMPHLVAKLPGGPHGLKVRWKLLVEYKRGNGYRASYVQDFTRPEDTVKFPASGEYTAEMDADQEWRIFETEDWTNEIAERGFFGGTAKLYMWFPSQGAEPTEPFMTFRIGGKNPDQAKAKTFINSTAGTQFTYAYAIAMHETYGRIHENGQIRFYNQFYTDYKQGPIGDASVDMGLAAWAKSWPLYNLDRGRKKDGSRYQNGPGGYGMYQLTLGPKLPGATIPTGGEQFIQRKEIWNWQDNVRGAINELQGKLSAAQSLLNGLQSTYSQWPAVPNEGQLSGLDAIVVTYYNGTGGLPSRKVNGASKKTPWTPEIQNSNTRYWKFHQNQQDYVQSVNGQIE